MRAKSNRKEKTNNVVFATKLLNGCNWKDDWIYNYLLYENRSMFFSYNEYDGIKCTKIRFKKFLKKIIPQKYPLIRIPEKILIIQGNYQLFMDFPSRWLQRKKYIIIQIVKFRRTIMLIHRVIKYNSNYLPLCNSL